MQDREERGSRAGQRLQGVTVTELKKMVPHTVASAASTLYKHRLFAFQTLRQLLVLIVKNISFIMLTRSTARGPAATGRTRMQTMQ